MKDKKILFILHNGPRFLGEIEDYIVISENWLTNDYIQNKHKVLVEKNDIVVDIGAHIGTFSIYAAKKATKGEVFAYEPAPKNYGFLLENIRLNGIDNLKAFNTGVAGSNSEKKLIIYKYKGHNSFFHSSLRKGVPLKIHCLSLQQIFDDNKLKKIDFLKIDCEGAEYEILFNTPKKYLDRINRIALECHENITQHNVCDMIAFLHNNDFKTFLGKIGGEENSLVFAKRRS